jgi:general secretion pathway protein I
LVEALVALAIVALGMIAVINSLERYAANASYMEQKTLASWIGTNKLTEISVAPTWPALGDYEDEVEFAGQQWSCEIVVSETDVDSLRRVDVSVKLTSDPKTVVHKVSGLIEPPSPPGFSPPQWSLQGVGGGEGGERG